MKKELTAAQISALKTLSNGPSLVTALTAHRLAQQGLVKKTGKAGARGKSHMEITPEGQAALAALAA